MRWGISFNVPAAHESDLWGLPPPSSKEVVQKWDGTKMINIVYHFQYTPQSWKEWQRVAGIKVQMKNRFHYIDFQEYDPTSIDGKIYTVSELGQHFKQFVKFPQPLFPGQKREAYKMLCRHAKRLYYENKLHIEQLIATSFRFNATDSEGISQTVKRALSAYKFAMDHCSVWATKLSVEALADAHKRGAVRSHQIRRDKSAKKRIQVNSLRASGKTLLEVANELDVSVSTIKRWTR